MQKGQKWRIEELVKHMGILAHPGQNGWRISKLMDQVALMRASSTNPPDIMTPI